MPTQDEEILFLLRNLNGLMRRRALRERGESSVGNCRICTEQGNAAAVCNRGESVSTLEFPPILPASEFPPISSGAEFPPPPPPPEHGKGRLMAVLCDSGEMSQTALADMLDIRPQSLSELISKTENEGLVTRRRDKSDKRRTLVSLTDEGKKSVMRFREANRKVSAEFLSSLNENEKNELYVILSKLVSANKEK